MFVWENSNRFNFARDHFIFEGVITRKKYTNKHRKSIQASLTFSGDLNKNEKKKKKGEGCVRKKIFLRTEQRILKKKKSYSKGNYLAGTREFFVPPFKRLFGEPPSSLGRKRGWGGGGDRSRAV